MNHETDPTPTAATGSTLRRGLITVAAATILIAGATAMNWATSAGASSGGDSAFVPMTPCRLFDTRPGADNVGPRSTPIGPDDTFVTKVTGAEGGCDIPEAATAISINATAVGPTAPSYATLYPAGSQRPLASNLNYVAGQSPTPNKVDVAISPDGRLAVYNAFGQVHLIADITGYYRGDRFNELDAGITGLRKDLALLDEAVAGVGETVAGINDTVGALNDDVSALNGDVGAVRTDTDQLRQEVDQFVPTLNFFAHDAELQELSASWTEVIRVETPVVGAGVAIANYSAVVREDDAGGAVICAVLVTQTNLDQWAQVFASGGFPGNIATLAGTRRFSFATPGPHTIRVMCMAPNGHAQAAVVTLSVDYRPGAA